MTETEWLDGYAVLRGEGKDGTTIDATERIPFKFKLVEEDGEMRLDLDHIVHVGPCDRSVRYPTLAIFSGDKQVYWVQPPPGAGSIGTYVALTPGQEIHS